MWALLSAAQEKGVSLTPALMPQKHKIVIYSQTEPETVSLEGRGGGDISGADGGNGSASTSGMEARSAWSSSSSSLPSPSPSPPTTPMGGGSPTEEGEGGPGGGGADGSGGAGGGENAEGDVVGNGNGTSGSGETGVRRDRTRRLLRGAPEVVLEVQPPRAAHAPATALTESAGNGIIPGMRNTQAGGAWGGGGEGLKGATSLEPSDRVLVASGVRVGGRKVQEEAPGATLVPETVQPTVAPTFMPAQAIDPAEPAAEGEWQQVVAYYQSLQLCLQEVRRKRRCAAWARGGGSNSARVGAERCS